MMDPTCTFSSPYFFTPRYFGLESRPFLVDPVPFLCAHSMTAVRGARSATRFGAGATRVAADALGIGGEVGTIEVGKAADLSVWNVAEPAELVYRIGFNPLMRRMIGGVFQ